MFVDVCGCLWMFLNVLDVFGFFGCFWMFLDFLDVFGCL